MIGDGQPKAKLTRIQLDRRGLTMVIGIFLAVSILIGSLVIRSRSANDRSSAICRDVNILNQAEQNNVVDGIPTKANLNKILYYQQNPGQVSARIQRDTARAIIELENLDKAECGPPVPNAVLRTLIKSTISNTGVGG